MLLMPIQRGSSLWCVSQPVITMEEIYSSLMAISMSLSEMGEGQGTNSVEPLEMDKTSQSMHNVSMFKVCFILYACSLIVFLVNCSPVWMKVELQLNVHIQSKLTTKQAFMYTLLYASKSDKNTGL